MNFWDYRSSRMRYLLTGIILLFSIWGISNHRFSVLERPLFEEFLVSAIAPLGRSLLFVRESIQRFANHYFFLVSVSQDRDRLILQTQELEEQIFRLKEIERENKRLKDLLQFGADLGPERILAQVVGRDSSNYFHVIRVNKGENQGIKLRSTVVTHQGLVGHVYQLGQHYADILTVLDQNNRIDALVDRTRSQGIVEGLSYSVCHMKYVARTEPIQVNDIVITAGLGHLYPKGLKVGTITRIERESYGITQLIEVTPSVDFKKLEEVVILVPREGAPSHEIGSPIEG